MKFLSRFQAACYFNWCEGSLKLVSERRRSVLGLGLLAASSSLIRRAWNNILFTSRGDLTGVSARAERGETKPESNRVRWVLALGVVLAFGLAGCSSQNFTPAPPPPASYYVPPPQNYRGSRTEVASWYGPGFAGRRTSSGETYNPEALTAASKTLPLGSHVRVTNPDTGRSVVVRINDRGPFVRGRSLDLSHGAAQRIGLTGKGVGRVQVASASGSEAPSYATAPVSRTTPSSRTAVYAYSLAAVGPSNLGGSYLPSLASSPPPRPRASSPPRRPSRRHYRYTHHRSSGSGRMVSNPIGAWIGSGFRF
jgi:peptidoglycan lytic transglycosylase